jgi:VanZ family protein
MRTSLSKFRLTIYALTVLAILWLSLSPHPYLPTKGLLSWDKAQHALAYAVLSLLGGWAFQPMMGGGLRPWRRAAWIALTYGILLEFAQMLFTSVRSAQFSDAVANGVGAFSVYFVARLIFSPRENRKQPEMD